MRRARNPGTTLAAVCAAAVALSLVNATAPAVTGGPAAAGGRGAAAETSSSASIAGPDGLLVTLIPQSGRYQVRSPAGWTLAGTLGSVATGVVVEDGRDEAGAFHEMRFHWRAPVPFTGRIRAYSTRPVLLFRIRADQGLADARQLRFPHFTELPRSLHEFSYASDAFAPARFSLERNGTPWLLYDGSGRAAVISPAANYMIASMEGDGHREIASALNEEVRELPAGFTHAALMAFGTGVNAAWEEWGRSLIALEGIQRPANDADVGLRYLGYWTDNHAEYYYNYDHALGYAGTLESLVRRYRTERIPIRYLQLDSWWYYKSLTDPSGKAGTSKSDQLPAGEWNRYGGLLRYEAHPALFPQGLAAFQRRIGLPLITHNRWVDPASPYHQHFQIYGFAPVDASFWKEIIGYLAGAGVVTYEQDWLNVIYDHSPALSSGLTAADAFEGGMAAAAAARGLTLQYSMALPRQFLQGSRYPDLTTIRVSGDGLTREHWDAFLFTSRLASALGIWPWTDVFMSTEVDNLLLATLSAGMVGIGDRIGNENRANLMEAVRSDGTIVKPDTPIVPVDAMYFADARQPMIAAAHTDHGALRSSYVFLYGRGGNHGRAAFTPAEVGVTREAYVYEPRRRQGQRTAPSATVSRSLSADETAYLIVVPLSRSGVALVGDEGKLVPDGRRRIAALDDAPGRLTATVVFAPADGAVRLVGFATHEPMIKAVEGAVGEVTFAPQTGRFTAVVSPAPTELREAPGNDSVRRAVVSFGQ
jgi:hypothetical protein